jgi:hypothetical protein
MGVPYTRILGNSHERRFCMKRTILLLAALALTGYANRGFADEAPAAPAKETKAPAEKSAKAEKMERFELKVTGGTKANRAEIEKLAKEEGAKHASLNVKSGELKISTMEGKTFDREAFSKKLTEKVPGVSVQ